MYVYFLETVKEMITFFEQTPFLICCDHVVITI